MLDKQSRDSRAPALDGWMDLDRHFGHGRRMVFENAKAVSCQAGSVVHVIKIPLLALR